LKHIYPKTVADLKHKNVRKTSKTTVLLTTRHVQHEDLEDTRMRAVDYGYTQEIQSLRGEKSPGCVKGWDEEGGGNKL